MLVVIKLSIIKRKCLILVLIPMPISWLKIWVSLFRWWLLLEVGMGWNWFWPNSTLIKGIICWLMVGEPNFIIIMDSWREGLISIQTMVGKKEYKFK